MGTAPQPPRPPAPPPQSGSHVVAIALMVLALIILVSVVALWTGFHILSRNVQLHVNDVGGDRKEVSIKTPFGAIEVNKKEVNEASLGLPIYPGAKAAPGHEDASVNMQFGNETAVRIAVGKFQSIDGFDKVRDFYQQRLTREVGKFTAKDIEFNPGHWDNEEGNFVGKDKEGKTVFEIKRKDYVKVAALKSEGDGTRIELVRVNHGKEDTN